MAGAAVVRVMLVTAAVVAAVMVRVVANRDRNPAKLMVILFICCDPVTIVRAESRPGGRASDSVTHSQLTKRQLELLDVDEGAEELYEPRTGCEGSTQS